jgi:hypothetical protein
MNVVAPPRSAAAAPLAVLDFLARFAFFLVAPAAVGAVGFIMPITGAVVNIALALVVFFAGESVRRLAEKRGLVGTIFKKQLQFEQYYRDNPARPFLYYVFYPLLFPYWLTNKAARREFLLFKGYTLGSFAILIGMAVYGYFARWYPELSVARYLPTLGITIFAEAATVLTLLMPLTTTVVTYHLRKQHGRLVALLAAGAFSIGAFVVAVQLRRDPIVSFETRSRLELRTNSEAKRAHTVQMQALRAAWADVKKNPSVIDPDGKITGEPLERVRKILDDGLYKTDESYAFDLWAFPPSKPDDILLYYRAWRGRRTVWVGLDARGREIARNELSPSVLRSIDALYGQ